VEQIDRRLLTKQGYIARALARKLIGASSEEKIPGVAKLAQDHNVGYGTVQEAMRLLEETGAVRFRRRGAQGTVLEEVRDEVLWYVANAGHLVGSMPLPYSRRYEGLATGLHTILSGAGIPISLSYMRGGIRRLEALIGGGSNFAITSLYTMKVFLEENPGALTVVMELGPGSYVTEHRLILADPTKRRIEPGMRVGIDRDSADQTRITEMEVRRLKGQVRLLPMTYTHLLRELQSGLLDAAVWNAEDINGSRFNVVPLESPEARELSGTNTVAAIGVRADDEFSARVVEKKLNRERLLEIQRRVLEGSELPRY
jgi:DNA-binding transcriptional ArsR family regulator